MKHHTHLPRPGVGGVMADKLSEIPRVTKLPKIPKIPAPSPPSPLSPAPPHAHTPTPPTSGVPGAEVKATPANPIAGGSPRVGAAAGGADGEAKTGGSGGGRLTFFKEGKFLLELSHRTDLGAPAGWVPVKSKTYWPPPSSTTTTTTHHPLRHDTPTSQSVSDDCSSLNSSPWTSDHIRKQSLPRPAHGPAAPPSLAAPFCFRCPAQARPLRRRLRGGRRRRNPVVPADLWLKAEAKAEKVEGGERRERKGVKSEGEGRGRAGLSEVVRGLCVRAGLKVEAEATLLTLFDPHRGGGGGGGGGEGVDPTFVSPRKRYLRQMEADPDAAAAALHRKKHHAAVVAAAAAGDRDRGAATAHVSTTSSSSSSSLSAPPRPAMSVLAPSVYSIDSILNHEAGAGSGSSRPSDSFLRTLLRPEVKPAPARARERPPDPAPAAPVKAERESSGPERGDALLELGRAAAAADRYDLARLGPAAGLYPLGPYVDPRCVMLHQLAPGLMPPAGPPAPEVAQALAAAAAAAAASLGTYPLGPLPHPMPAAQYYYPPTTAAAAAAAQLLRPPPLPARCSPHPPASPSPKTQYPPPTPASPLLSRGASPRGRASPWQPPPPPAHPLSPHPSLASPLPSPPPQDAPLNLSKPRNHPGK